jgi:hypothetical protein
LKRTVAATLIAALLPHGALAQDGPSRGVITLSAEDSPVVCKGTQPSGAPFSYAPRPVYFVFSGQPYTVSGATWTNAFEPVATSTQRLVTILTGVGAGNGPVGRGEADSPSKSLFLETPGGRTVLGPGVFTEAVRT